MKLSVCIPVHNVAPYFERCVRSLFEQTYADLEYIFVDDASRDDSITIIERLLADYPVRKSATRIIRHETARGALASRLEALSEATGELVAFCDSDDWLDANFYADLARPFENAEVDLAFAPMVRNENSALTNGVMLRSFDGRGADYLHAVGSIEAFNSMVNKVFRRTVASSRAVVPEGLSIAEDLCWTTQIVAHCRRAIYVPTSRYHYRVNEASLSRAIDPRKAVKDFALVYNTLKRELAQGEAAILRKQVLRDLLWFDLRFGGLLPTVRGEFYADFRALKSVPWSPDTSSKRRVILLLAERFYPIVRWLFAHFASGKLTGF